MIFVSLRGFSSYGKSAMQREKHYIVYKTWNIRTGSYYLGAHETWNLADDYLGSGTRLQHAIRKYGRENFRRRILRRCRNREEMYAYEKKVIAIHLGRKLCMNIAEGGKGGWKHVNTDERCQELRAKYRRKGLDKGRETFVRRMKSDPEYYERHRQHLLEVGAKGSQIAADMRRGKPGRPHTEESRAKIGAKNAISNLGERNGSFGSSWLSHDVSQLTARVPRERVQEFLDAGWRAGRAMRYELVQVKYLEQA